MTDININDLENLITYFAKNTYKATVADVRVIVLQLYILTIVHVSTFHGINDIYLLQIQEIMQRCKLLASFDYDYHIIDNNEGNLCGHYPRDLIILEHDKLQSSKKCDTSLPAPHIRESMTETIYLKNKLRKLMKESRFARCRSRFPTPVILYKGRHVCRSATLASKPEMIGRTGLDLLSNLTSTSSTSPIPLVDKSLPQVAEVTEDSKFTDMKNNLRLYDIELLKTLNVRTIIDFMVEKKKVKFGVK